MTPLDEAPEQRWRRTVDRRNRPAKLKVDRLLRDFGYAELDPEVGDAIEARLAGVALAVAPSLRDAMAGEVVTIYANDSAVPEEGRVATEAAPADPGPAQEPSGVSDVAQMVSYLKQQVLDARAEAERLRTELDRRIAARMDSERDNEAIIAEQAAALEEQSRQIAELGAALNSTRQALAETRDEIRRAVGELQALPQPAAADRKPPPFAGFDPASLDDDDPFAADEETFDAPGLSGEESADGREEAEAAELAPVEPGEADDLLLADEDEDEDADADELGPPAAGAAEEPVREVPEPVFDLDEPPLGDQAEPKADVPDPMLDLDEPPLGVEEEAGEPGLELDEPPPVGELAPRDGADLELDLDEPAAEKAEFDIEQPARAPVAEPAPGAGEERQVAAPAEPREQAAGPAAPTQSGETPPPAEVERLDDLDVPLPPSDEWLPLDLRSDADGSPAAAEPAAAAAAGEPQPGDDGLPDFDDFLYDAEELYDPDEPGRGTRSDAPLESEIEARWADEPTSALPPPPPAPPSPWADEPDPSPPAVADRPTLGKTLRGRGRGRGRGGRGRWEGSCSICGRLPQVDRRKDLEAAGWDLDDEAAACPQCRGVG